MADALALIQLNVINVLAEERDVCRHLGNEPAAAAISDYLRTASPDSFARLYGGITGTQIPVRSAAPILTVAEIEHDGAIARLAGMTDETAR